MVVVAVVAMAAAAAVAGDRVNAPQLGAAALLLALARTLCAQAEVGAVAAQIVEPGAWLSREVGEGVELRQRRFPSLFDAPQSLSVLVVRGGGTSRFDVVAPGRRTRTSAMGEAGGALAAINGGFFEIETTGLSRGLLRLDGNLVTAASPGQASVGFDARGWPVLATRDAGDWPEVHDALGAGPMLLVAGKVVDHGPRQRGIRHPRSALGLAPDAVVLLAIDGRNAVAAGMTFEETATVLQAFGCSDALNLDGGGSTTMWLAGLGVVNHPCDNRKFDHAGERAVANAILLRAPAVVVVDDDAAELHGDGWRQRQDGGGFHGADFATCEDRAARAVFVAELPFAGRWRAFGRQPLAAGASWRVALPGVAGGESVPVAPGAWRVLGECTLAAGGVATVEITAAGGMLVVDAVRWLQVVE